MELLLQLDFNPNDSYLSRWSSDWVHGIRSDVQEAIEGLRFCFPKSSFFFKYMGLMSYTWEIYYHYHFEYLLMYLNIRVEGDELYFDIYYKVDKLSMFSQVKIQILQALELFIIVDIPPNIPFQSRNMKYSALMDAQVLPDINKLIPHWFGILSSIVERYDGVNDELVIMGFIYLHYYMDQVELDVYMDLILLITSDVLLNVKFDRHVIFEFLNILLLNEQSYLQYFLQFDDNDFWLCYLEIVGKYYGHDIVHVFIREQAFKTLIILAEKKDPEWCAMIRANLKHLNIVKSEDLVHLLDGLSPIDVLNFASILFHVNDL